MNDIEKIFTTAISRRAFVATGSLLLLPSIAMHQSKEFRPFTVQQIIDVILKNINVPPILNTTDTIKAGSPDQLVTGVVTTMFATLPVIKKAVELKSNFIIAHEPTFYNHMDETQWLEKDEVWQFKNELLKKNNIAVWRFHDYWHSNQPDGVLMGVLTAMGWEKYYDAGKAQIVTVPPISLKEIVVLAKTKLGITNLRVIGDLSQVCRRIALVPGAAGGRRQMQLIQSESPDVLLCGESPEWETVEYIRDAQDAGIKKSLIVLGHAVSEEPGMEWLVQWLKSKVPGITITHVPSGNPFKWM
jgi:putative NIF3 family GTP cyclohydrolase 1 type 2